MGTWTLLGLRGVSPGANLIFVMCAAADLVTTSLLLGYGGVEVNPLAALIIACPLAAVSFKIFGLLTMNAIVIAFNTYERGSAWASYCPGIFIAVSSSAVGWNLGQILADAAAIAA